jgi:putative phosphoribosyl transferase
MGRIPEGQTEVVIDAGGVHLPGFLGVPGGAAGLVIFAHGSGSGRLSPRNHAVAAALRGGGSPGLATLLLDLLTEDEALDRAKVFDIPLLAGRLRAAGDWARADPRTAGLTPGYFGASTGAGAALLAAADEGRVGAVVSRGGRPDLAGEALGRVACPTLLIVGGRDEPVIELNREAMEKLVCPARLEIVPGATHLFEEPGTLERVAELAREWLARHL